MPRSKASKKRKLSPPADKTLSNSSQSVTKDEPEEKVLKFSGKVPVDEGFPHYVKGRYHVYEHNQVVYNAMLNQTNIGQNNNKYYIIQKIKHNTENEFITLCRWGRVGKVAGKSDTKGNFAQTEREFCSKFRAKTGNNWYNSHNFVGFNKIKGKYDLVKIDYGSEVAKEKEKMEELFSSNLAGPVQDLMRLIFNTSEWEASVREMKFDVKKAPLGKLTEDQIKAGYASLKKIEDCLKPKINKTKLEEACSEFYTKIPHDFGMKKPPLIDTIEAIKDKMELLDALRDIQIGVALMKQEKGQNDKNPLDVYYESLQCQIEPLDRKSSDFKYISEYIDSSIYSYIKILDVFRVHRETDDKRFKKNIGNRMLLWHGSRLTNWCGILKQGLRIAPPEAPATGYNFGKGVYFADVFLKAFEFCFVNFKQPYGLLLLSEVALGNTNEKREIDFKANQLPTGKYSTKALGTKEPDKSKHFVMPDGTIVPLGKLIKVEDSWRLYNQFVVYDVCQINPRYLIKVEAHL